MSVCEIWINGSRMAASGVVGSDAQTEEPRAHYVIAESPKPTRLMEIMLLVSNHHNVQDGLNGDVLLGSSQQIDEFYSTPRLLGASMAGALFCLSILHIVLFYMRRSSKENLYFGLFSLFWCMAILFSPSSGFLMTVFAPSIPWGWYINLSLLPYGVTIPLMLLFYHSLFPKKYGKAVERVYLGIALAYMIYILLTPPNAYDVVLLIYCIMSGIALLYMFVCYSIDLLHKEKGVSILLLGYLALGLAELDDMFFDLNIIDVASLRPVGVLFFIFSYAFYLAFRFSTALTKTEILSKELEQKNIRLLQLDKLKDEFLANTTHELKTPLAGMVGIAESLVAGTAGGVSRTVAAHLNVIAHSGKRLSKLINDVLDLSRLKNQDIALRLEVVNLYASAQRVLALAQALNRGGKTILANDVPADFPDVVADPDRLEQVLFNLIGNSLKSTASGRISIAATNLGDRVEIAVTDTGCGIAAEDQARIFNAYEQGSYSSAGGTGLGLSISRYLVELHGGVLDVKSEMGVGSSFYFTLPLAVGCALDLVEHSVHSSTPSTPSLIPRGTPLTEDLPPVIPADLLLRDTGVAGGKYQVLVVDDEPVNLQVVAAILNIEGISFRTAANGAMALRMLEDGDQPDMVLLDVMMPDMSGYAVCRELRKTYQASVLPIVLLTVKNRVEDIVEGFSAGANDYLTKPFAREELGARVALQIKLKAAYEILEENLELKRELDLRRKTESGLRFMQARLAKILDSLDDAIVGVNVSSEIAFCNQSFRTLVGGDGDSLLGHPLTSIMVAPEEQCAAELLGFVAGASDRDGSPVLFDTVSLVSGGESFDTSIWCNVVELEEETLCLLSVYSAKAWNTDGGGVLSSKLIRELSEDRQRFLRLEETMLSLDSSDFESRQQVLENVKAIDELLTGLCSRLGSHTNMQTKRSMSVTVVKLAVDCWTASTGTAKADMAEQSGLWNVYMERDGYFRTQTLDKYLDPELLPQKPRWQKVLATADFVLANCEEDSPCRRELEEATADFRALF